jgi:hypothetical protein
MATGEHIVHAARPVFAMTGEAILVVYIPASDGIAGTRRQTVAVRHDREINGS